MDIEAITFLVIGVIFIIYLSAFVFNWHYLRSINEKNIELTKAQQTNKKQVAELNSAEEEIKRFKYQCDGSKIDAVLKGQKIEDQKILLAEVKNEKMELISKLDRSDSLINTLTADKAKLENGQKERYKQIDEYKINCNSLSYKLDNSNKKIYKLEAYIREQKAILKSEEEKIYELKEQFEKQKMNFKNEFKVLSEKIIKDRQEILNGQNQVSVSALITPLQEQIVRFQQRINEVHL